MMNDTKENDMGHLSCKSHTTRTEKDLYRICPSKLSKRELEDLYFALLDQNVQLKKTVNDQRDQIKVLNTRVQRMTVQRPVVGFHNRDCCAGSKAIINEQKETIADLKTVNDRLSERLRLLNMRLCSAKQFLRRGSSQVASHCSKCLVSSASIKNSSMSALNTKRSDTKLRIDSSSCQLEKDNAPIRPAEIPTQSAEVTSSRAEIPVREAPCRRSECRAEIDELKLKVVALEEEACGVRRCHSERMRALEAEAGRARAELRGSRTRADELSSQLRLQRSLVTELQLRDRATEHLHRAAACLTNRILPLIDVCEADPQEPVPSDSEDCPPIVVNNISDISLFVEEKCHKNSDDSGFTDYKKQDSEDEKERTLQERDDNIETRIANLQSQLEKLKANVAGPPGGAKEAQSSLSHDIFSTARFKTLAEFDKVPSTSREPEVLVSSDRIYNESGHAPEKMQKYGPELKYHISGALSLDMSRRSLEGTGTDIRTAENETKNKNPDGSRGSRGSTKINSAKAELNKKEVVHGDEKTTIEGLDISNQIVQRIVEEEKTNNALNKNRRSSLKPPYDRKQSRDIAVRYRQTQTYKSSPETEPNTKYISQKTDIDKVYVEPDDDHESDPSVQYKVNERTSIRNIRYMNDVETERRSPGFDPGDNGNRGGGTDGVHNGIDIRRPRDVTPVNPYEAERTFSAVPNDKAILETIAADDTNNPVLCGGLSRVCACPPDAVPRPLSLRSSSGACAHRPLQFPPLPSPEPRPASPDRTDCEVSSLTDLTYTRDPSPSDYRSPGEEKETFTLSESCATTEYGSLSEGEVPPEGGQRLSTTADKMTESGR